MKIELLTIHRNSPRVFTTSQFCCWFVRSLSSRRMSPHNSQSTLIYSSAVESFGITSSSVQSQTSQKKSGSNKLEGPVKKKSVPNKTDSPSKKKSTNSGKMVLTELPFEMLEKIFKLLDSFRFGKTIYFESRLITKNFTCTLK